MLTITNVEVHGLERAMAASKNPMSIGEIHTERPDMNSYVNFDKPYEQDAELASELKRAKALGKAAGGSGHDNFLKGIIVQFDVKYPQYWTPEYQRYKFESIVSSQSKMHRLLKAASTEEFDSLFNSYVDKEAIDRVQSYVKNYNEQTEIDQANRLLVGEGGGDKQYYWFMKALSNLPLGYEMWMTCSSNYLSLKTIVNQRWNHKLREWRLFCKTMLDELPLFKELIGFQENINLK